jgi:hypothetical protein
LSRQITPAQSSALDKEELQFYRQTKEATMTTGLIIKHGSPHWWLSPDIWLAMPPSTKTSPAVNNPIAGKTYDVWVRVRNPTNDVLSTPVLLWGLQVIWAYPTAGPIPLPTSAANNLNSTDLPSISGGQSVEIKCMNQWTPSTGHECIVAWTNASNIAYPMAGDPYLAGDAGPGDNWSIAQHNFSVLPGIRKIHFAFQVCNGAAEELSYNIAARQAPLQEIEGFLPGVPGGRTVLDRPGKVERLGIVASANPSAAELEQAPAELKLKIAPRSCLRFTLSGTLLEGNALINIIQTQNERVVGGLSVLAMAEEKG